MALMVSSNTTILGFYASQTAFERSVSKQVFCCDVVVVAAAVQESPAQAELVAWLTVSLPTCPDHSSPCHTNLQNDGGCDLLGCCFFHKLPVLLFPACVCFPLQLLTAGMLFLLSFWRSRNLRMNLFTPSSFPFLPAPPSIVLFLIIFQAFLVFVWI